MSGHKLGETVKQVAVLGGSLHVEEQGSGPAIVLLHGWALDARVWTRQFGRLTDKFRLIAPDRRGFGRSTAPPGLGHEPQDILDLLDQMHIDQCVLWGMSQGGRVAQRFAAKHSDRLSGLILQSAPMDGVAPPPASEAIPIEAYTQLAHQGDLNTLRQKWLAHPIMKCDDLSSQSVVASMVASYDARDLNAPGDMGRPCEGLAGVQVPTLVTVGTAETNWLISTAKKISSCISRSTLQVINDAGHFSNLTHPEVYEGWLSISASSFPTNVAQQSLASASRR